MELMEVILSKENLNNAYKKVVANKGAAGVDGIKTEELESYIKENREKNLDFLKKQNLYANASTKSVYTKIQWKEKTIGNTNNTRQNHTASHSQATVRHL